ncbi:MAG: 2-hydroxychromene-2-carboxylate isomerase [Bradymonadia bacterium]
MLTFYFDFISPYAWLAWTQIHDLAARHGVEVDPAPILFAALLNHHGQLGPAEIPAKRLFTFKDVVRKAARLGQPLVPPPAHPFNPLLGLRLASLDLDPAPRRLLIDTLFRAVWADGPGITDPVMVTALLQEVGLDGEALVARTADPEVKARVKARTAEAIDREVFGVPTTMVGDEPFWGVETLPDVELALQGADPVTPELMARWANLPAQSHRPKSPQSQR